MQLFKKKWVKASLLLFASILLLLIIFHTPILNGIASTLVRADEVREADAIVLLAGDRKGERTEAAIKLFKEGYGKKIIFWGGQAYWKFNYAELYIKHMEASGIPRDKIIWSSEKLTEHSTRGEAKVNQRLMKQNGVRSFILVTSHYHSKRAGSVYEPFVKENNMKMYVFPAEDSVVHLEGWWKDRASAKMVFMELQKKLFYLLSPG